MAKNKKIFATGLTGYRKKTVNKYVEQKNAELKKLSAEKEKLSTENSELTAQIKELSSQNTALKVELESMEKMYDRLFEKFNEMQGDKDRVARILVDAERRADEIMNTATDRAKAEKMRLEGEISEITRGIYEKTDVLRETDDMAKENTMNLIARLREAVDTFENDMLRKIEENTGATEAFIKSQSQKITADTIEVEEEPEIIVDNEDDNPADNEPAQVSESAVAEETLTEPAETTDDNIPDNFGFAASDDAKAFFN